MAVITGTFGDDSLTGTADADQIEGRTGHDRIKGLAGDDVIGGGDGFDEIDGGDGNDVLNGGANGDVLTGGAGDDQFFIDGDMVIELAGGGNDRIFTSTSYALAAGLHVEILSTTNNAGTDAIDLRGNELVNSIAGNNGANTLFGGLGADTLNGLGGNDRLYVDNAGDVVIEYAGGGNDRVFTSTSYVLDADAHVETLSTVNDAGTDAIDLTGSAFDNSLIGNEGNNVLDGGAGSDTMTGFAGDDWYLIDDPGDFVVEAPGGGNDRIITSVSYALAQGIHVEILSTTNDAGTAAIDLTGNGTANSLTGNAGANVLDGGGGADTMIGLGGDDIFYVDNAGDAVMETAGGGTDRVFATASYALAAGVSVEMLSVANFEGTSAINLAGNELANELTGNFGDNVLNGGAGADTMNGAYGTDIYFVDDAGDVVDDVSYGDSNDRVFASVSYVLAFTGGIDILSTTNNSGTDAINLTGNNKANSIAGNNGNNVLDGAYGADTLNGLGGDDTFFVDNAGDVIIEYAGGGTDRVFTSVSHVLNASSHVEFLSTTDDAGTNPMNLTGNGLANTITGNNGDNTLSGRGGADTLIGLGGFDVYIVDNLGDVVIETGLHQFDVVHASVDYALAAGASVERLTTTNHAGIGGIDLTGNELGNEIIGNAGANVLDGLGGNDALNGLGGNDTLNGLDGADTFRFTTALGAGNVDTITGYVVADDKIEIDNAVFTGLAIGELPALRFNTGAAASEADDRIIYNSATGALLFDADGNGGGAAVQFATLAAGLAMAAGEFVVI